MPWHCYIWRHRCSVWRTESAIVFLCGIAENRGGLWFSIPNPTTLLTAQICSTKTNCISSRKAPVTDARSVNTKYCLFFSRRKLKQERGRRSESELFYQIQWGLEVSSISFSRVGRSTSMSLNISNANFSYHGFLKMSFSSNWNVLHWTFMEVLKLV